MENKYDFKKESLNNSGVNDIARDALRSYFSINEFLLLFVIDLRFFSIRD